MTGFLLYFALAIPAGILIGRMRYCYFQGKYPSIAERDRRGDAGDACIAGFIGALLWPIFLPFEYCASGFAEFGILAVKTSSK